MATDIESRNLSAWFIEQINHIIEGNPSNHSTVKILLHNLTKLLKDSHYNGTHILKELENGEENYDLDRITENRRVGYVAFCVLITLYSIVIFAGSCGNGLVIWAVIRRPTMRTLRNTFIINLAVSDLLLCLVTMPLTLVEIITKYWPLGDSAFSCKMAGGLQAVSIFVSTMSITAISLDRYQLIVYPTTDYLKKIGAAAGLFSIWIFSFLLALPIFLFRSLDHHLLWPHPSMSVASVDYCYENWPISHGRALYSACTIILQYAAPIIIVSVVHAKICRRLRLRQSMLITMAASSRKQAAEKNRLRRLNTLLMIIAFIFALCWMPLNVYNLVLDLHNPFQQPEDQEMMLIIYAVCHLLGMSSATANPFLYGWFNDNFRSEFSDIAAPFFRCCPSINSLSISRTSSSKKMQNLGNQQHAAAEESSSEEGNRDTVAREREERQMADCSCATTNNMLSTMVHCEITLELPTPIGSVQQVETSEML